MANNSSSINKIVALTFDDGPNPPYTNQILDILKKEGIKATFFVCGANAKRHPELIKKIHQDGHLLGNHSYNHSYVKTRLGLIRAEIMETQKIIYRETRQKELLFRAPWGFIPFWLSKKLHKDGFKIISYSGIARDWIRRLSPEQIAKNVNTKIKPGQNLLLHDGMNTREGSDRSKTVAALPVIINNLRSQGYQFVPLIITSPRI